MIQAMKTIILLLALTLLSATYINAQNGAYNTGIYKNLFKDVLGKTDAEINTKVNNAFQHIFYGGSNEKLYYESGSDMAYMLDVNNNDVRTEGMSYGMMICVQLDKKAEFDKLWKWAKTYMQYGSNNNFNGYFAWQCNTNGTIKGDGPASDGEAYFVTALFFAAHRWGNGTGIFNYEAEAQDILNKVMSKTGAGSVYNLFNTNSKMITFVPYGDSYGFTDPSYHLPAFWELWALWSNTNQSFWAQTPAVSRSFLQDASHPTSGLTTDYSEFNGTPKAVSYNQDANKFMYDAWRTAMNIGMDYNWFQADSWQPTGMTKLLTFFKNKGSGYLNHYNWDGTSAGGDHSTGLVACNAAACLAVSDQTLTQPFVQEFWNIAMPTGTYRYYDGMLYMLSLLNCSGNFKIYKPEDLSDITISVSTDASQYSTPATVALSATASTTSGTISKVTFYEGTNLLGEATAQPYTYSWTSVAAGTYSITAVATDDQGNTKTSSPVVISVTAPALNGVISIRALGIVGDETIELEVDGVVIDTWTLSTSYADYTAIANVNGIIRVNYTNDDGADRDAQIDYIVVAGTTYQAEDQAVNTGYYANGACGGGGNSELMHCSGYIEFETNPVSDLCPTDPNKTDPGICGCNVPDTDTDADGTADCEDECPNDPDKILEGECGCGVVEGTCNVESIALTTGWNLIGYPHQDTKELSVALASVWQYVNVVKDMNVFYHKTQPAFLNSLTELSYGVGYLIYVTQDCELLW